jgi:hypothetical protein
LITISKYNNYSAILAETEKQTRQRKNTSGSTSDDIIVSINEPESDSTWYKNLQQHTLWVLPMSSRLIAWPRLSLQILSATESVSIGKMTFPLFN